MREHKGMRPHDIVALLKILGYKDKEWQNKDLAQAIGISQAEMTHSLGRSDHARLYDKTSKRVNRNNLYEFLIHGISYVFPVLPGTMVSGIPTAHSHPHFATKFISELKYVWPSINGNERGLAIEPLYANQVKAVATDEELYLLLACVDVIRVGRIREIEKAKELLRKKILNELPGKYHENQSSI